VELSNLATGNEVFNDSSDWLPQYDNAGVHLSQSALQTTTGMLTIGNTIGWSKPHVLDPFLIAGFGNSYAASSPFGVCNANPSNLATGSALHYNSSNFMPQSIDAEVHLAQPAFHAAPAASTQDEFTCSRCGKAFKRKGDLTRHGKSHGLTKFYCVYASCPRHVYAKGFHRKDKLVDHLELSHKMTKEDARHWATSANIACKW
jgi:Zinc finger, C2H2 type